MMDDKKVFDITEVVDNVIGVENININKCMFDRKNIFIHLQMGISDFCKWLGTGSGSKSIKKHMYNLEMGQVL